MTRIVDLVASWLQTRASWRGCWYIWKLKNQIRRGVRGRPKYSSAIEAAGAEAIFWMRFRDTGLRLSYWNGALEIEDIIYKADLEAQGKKIGTILFQWDQ